MYRNFLKMAVRNALRNRTSTAINISSLVLGLTLFFLISLWVKKEYSYDKNFANADRIYRVQTNIQMEDGFTNSFAAVGWPVGRVLAKDYPGIEYVTYLKEWSPIIKAKGAHFYETALYADPQFFNVFQYQLSEGNATAALSEPFSIVISKQLAEKYFGDQENVVGKILMINDTVPYKVTGVFKDLSAPSHLKFDMIGSLSSFCSLNPDYCKDEFQSGWFDINIYNYVKLKESVSADAVASQIKNLVLVYGKDAVEKTGFKSALNLRPLTEVYLHSNMATASGTTGNIRTVRLFLIIGIFILFIACLNFINLTTAKSVERAKEIGVKKVLGSNRRNLVFQFITETTFLCIFAAIISVLLVFMLLPLFNQFTGEAFTKSNLFSWSNILLLLSILVLLIPLAGFYPALVLSSYKPISVLKGKLTHNASGALLRNGLVITQFVISIAFIICTFIIWKQMHFMQEQNLGFDKDKILIVDAEKVPWLLRHNSAMVFENHLSGQPGISNISAANAVPGRSGWSSQFAWAEGKPKNVQLVVEYIPVDEHYINTLGLQLKAGRDFMPGSKADSEEGLIINEAAAKYFGWGTAENAIGKKLSTSGKDGKVIGVLKDYHQHGLQDKISPVVLGIGSYINMFAVRYDRIGAKQLTELVTAAWKDTYGGYPLNYSFMDEDFQRQYEKEQRFKNLFDVASALSILIACMGLLGLAIYTAQKRIKEIGVRKVLGASVGSIVALLSSEFLKLVFASIIIAIPIAWWSMNKWLQGFAYRINVGWEVFLFAGILAIVIAMATVSFQAIKAAIENPVKSLRNE